MKIFNLKIVCRQDTINGKHGFKGKYFYREFVAGSIDHAFELARKEYSYERFDIFAVNERRATTIEHKNYINALINRQCYECG